MAFCSVMLPLLVTISILDPTGSVQQATQYYITPSIDTPCSAEPCLTLNQFAQEVQQNLTSNATLMLLPGDHNLISDIKISDVSHFSMLGNSTTHSYSAVVSSSIVCTLPAFITFENISELEISTIAIVSCGASSTSSVVHVKSVQHFELSNVTLQNSMSVSLKVCDSNGLLRGTQFIGNSRVGINVTNSTVTFKEENTFLGNQDGGIASCDSTLNFRGSTRFVNNTAGYGGGISAERTTINCNGSFIFTGNTAEGGGGGIFAEDNTTVNINGNSCFTNNSALYGGGIYMQSLTTANINRESSFISNIAWYGGGISARVNNTVNINANVNFINNTALLGGGICAEYNSTVNIDDNRSFVNSSAQDHGGRMYTQYVTTADINRESSFISNSAHYGGGIFVWKNSTVNINADISFMNAALWGGGICAEYNTTVNINGGSSFIGNLAEGGGGGICTRYSSTVNINGDSSFINNSAWWGAGIYANESSIVNISGNSSFINNFVQHDGGGICAHYSSTVNIDGHSSFINNSAWWGGGIFANESSTVNISGDSSFIDNSAQLEGGGITSHSNSIVNINGGSSFINNSVQVQGGGISAHYSSTMNINGGSSFINNSALQYGGGICAWDDSIVNINADISLINNTALLGGGICEYNSTVNINDNSSFVNNSVHGDGGGIYAYGSSLKCNGRINFKGNSAKGRGGGISAVKGSTVSLSGETSFTENLSQYGGGVVADQSDLTLVGMTIFGKNSASYGGAIYVVAGKVTFNGDGNLTKNSATVNGGALSLAGNSKCYFALNSLIYFGQNDAMQYGGAIYVEEIFHRYCTTVESYQMDEGFIGLECTGVSYFNDTHGHQWEVYETHYNFKKEVCEIFQKAYIVIPFSSLPPIFHLDFKDNTAQAGSVLYGGEIDRMNINLYYGSSRAFDVKAGELFDNVATIKHNVTDSSISSDPFHVCPCFNNQPDCRIPAGPYEVSVYPGQTFPTFLVAVGQRNGTVPATIHSSFDSPGAEFGDLEDAQQTNLTCTNLHYTIFSNRKTENITLYAEGPCGDSGISLSVLVTLLSCPTGFMISKSKKSECICDSRLERYTNSCNINDQTIARTNGNFWAGLHNKPVGLILHSHCPFDYCKSGTVSFRLNDSDSQCNYKRSGLLCGGCQPGLSLVLGSSRCLQCSNGYLSLFIAFILAGIGLVILLLILKLTVAIGTINGLVFYANIIAVNRALFFPSGESNILTVFIAWVNLDLGFETCFISGMDTYTRTWLQFLFPAYVWALVGAIILFSHYSTWVARCTGRNPVAVLATLFLLSYNKLLRTVITAFSFTFLEYPNGLRVKVWLFDGNIRFLDGKHIPLFMAALLVLVFLFIPYTLLLLLGQWIQAHSRKKVFSWISDYRVKSFLDAYQAPFMDKHRYYVGAVLGIRCCLFLVSAFNVLGDPRVNLLVISSSMLGLAIISIVIFRFIGGIYKERYLDILDASFILNLGILANGTFYVRESGGNQAALMYTSVGIAFATFCAILVYHAQRQIRDSDLWRNNLKPKILQLLHGPQNDSEVSVDNENDTIPTPAVPPTTTYIELREPLLTD